MPPQTRTAVSWLTSDELNPTYLDVRASLAEAVRAFQRDSDLRLLPVVDLHGRPVGAIFEREIRRLLLNPFGHALLQNPTFGGEIASHIRPCPVEEMTNDIGRLIEAYRTAEGREGMILTVGGKLLATLTNRRLLMLAAEEEHRASARRIQRAERIESASRRFETRTAKLASQMLELADTVQRLAEATADRANIAGDQATSVAGAAMQTRDTLGKLAGRGHGLAIAFDQIERTVTGNRSTASACVTRVLDGATRARNLLEAARSVDQVTDMVSRIAGTVNLLSLNATIEAARAGESGRGFAVVAREIRKLSDDAKQATQAITGQMHMLRAGIEQVANDYDEVEDAILEMAQGASQIDEAVASEADTTRLIADSVAEASQAGTTIEQAVTTIVSSVRTASSSARELDRMASSLRTEATAFGMQVGEFLEEVRVA